MILPARFGHCSTCGRLITVDATNPDGACTRACGGRVFRVLERDVKEKVR